MPMAHGGGSGAGALGCTEANWDVRIMDTRPASLLIALFLSIQITACGGGNHTLATLQVTVVTPGDGANGVQLSAQPTITFSAAVNPTSVTAGAVTLSSGRGMQDSTVSVSGNQITIKPKASLLSQTAYTLTVTMAIRGIDGEQLSQDFVAHFTTLSQWGTPQVIGHAVNGAAVACAPQIGFDASGDALAAWPSLQPQNQIYWNRYVPGSGWSGAQSFATDTGIPNNVLKIAVAANGNAFAVWMSDPSTIYAGAYNVGTGWSAPAVVATNAGSLLYGYPPEVGTDSAGNGMIVWSAGGIWSTHYANGSWSEPLALAPGAPTDSFGFAMNPNGDAMAIWSILGPPFSVFASHYGAGSGWSSPQAINGAYMEAAQAGDQNGFPAVAIDSSGNAVALWPFIETPVSAGPEYASYYSAGGSWGAPQGLSGSAVGTNDTIAMGGVGNALAVWWSFISATDQGLFVNSYMPGQGWGSSVMIGPPKGPPTANPVVVDSGFPSAAIDGQGNALLVWAGNLGVLSAHYSAGTGWSDPISIDTPTGHGVSPLVAIDSTGKAIAVWCEAGTANNVDIYANSFTPGS
jgi:hypothetical protein